MSWMCFVLFSDDPPVNVSDLARHYQATWPGQPPLGPPETKDNVVSFDIGGDSLLIGRMPAAIPGMQIDDQLVELMWPNCKRDVEKHRSHWIVTIVGKQGKPADKARLLTRFVQAVLASHPTALGITWGAHAHLVSSKNFQEGAISLRGNEDPVHLWITVRCGWRPEGPASGKSAGMTRGLADFELMEIEAIEALESPTDLFDRLQGLAGYLIKRGPVVRDGDTVGADEDEKIKVVYSDSAFGAEGRVMRLVYGDGSGVGGKTPSLAPFAPQPMAPVVATPVAAMPVTAMPVAGIPAVGMPQVASPYGATTAPAVLPPNNSSWRPPGPGGPPPSPQPGAWTPPPVPNASGSWTAPGSTPAFGSPNPAGYPQTYKAPATTSVLAIFSLICGIISPVLWCACFLSLPVSIMAVVMGHIALSQIKHSGGRLTGRGLALAGVIIGYVVTAISLAFMLWIFVIAPSMRPKLSPNIVDPDEIQLDFERSKGSGPEFPSFPKQAIPSPFPAPSEPSSPPASVAPKNELPDQPSPAEKSSTDAAPPTAPTTNPAAPGGFPTPGNPPFGSPAFPPIPLPRGPGFPEGIPGGPPNFPPFPTPGRMPTVPDPFAPADSTGKTTGKSTPGRTRTGQEAIDPATIEASLPNMQWPVKSLGFSGDSTRVAIGRLDSTIVVFDLKSKQTIWQRERLNELGQATVVALTPEGKTLIAGGFSGRLFAWNLDEPDAPPRELTSHSQPITSLDMQREGKFILTGAQDGKVMWQPPAQPDKSRTLSVFNSPVRAVRVGTPATTAWVTDGKEVAQIDLRKSEVLRKVNLGRGGILAAAISQDARYVAVSEGSKVKLWEIESGKELAPLESKSGPQWTVRFTPDGNSLVAGSHGKLIVWDYIKGEQRKTLSLGGTLYVQTLAISADSRFVASILDSAGQTLYVLKLGDGESTPATSSTEAANN